MGVKILALSRSEREQLDRIELQNSLINAKLNFVLLMERIDMADEQALDDAIAALSAQQDELDGLVQQILDKVANAAPEVDLTDEIASLQGIKDKAATATDALKAAVAPAEPPVEEPPAPA